MLSRLLPSRTSAAVLSAASITPPVAPKIAAGAGRNAHRFVELFIGQVDKVQMRTVDQADSSRVVMEISVSGIPSPAASWSSRSISNFFAVQGMTLTNNVFGSKAVLLSKPGLNHGAGHLLRGLTGGTFEAGPGNNARRT